MIIWLLRRQYTHVSHPFTRPSIYSVLVVFNDSMNVLHSQFHVHSCQCNCTLLHCALFSILHQPGCSSIWQLCPDTRAPASVQVSSVHRSLQGPPAANQRPGVASGDQWEGGEWPSARPSDQGTRRVFKVSPGRVCCPGLMVSVTTLQKLSGSEFWMETRVLYTSPPNTYWIMNIRALFAILGWIFSGVGHI